MRLHPKALQIGTDYSDTGHTKLYFLEGEKKAIIDTGVATSPERDIAPYLAYYGYKLGDIDVILNTHGHFDHTEGNPAIPQAEVWIHEDDAYMIEDPAKAFDSFQRPAMRLRSETQIAAEKEKYVSNFKRQKASRKLKDGDVIDLGKGVELKVVQLPGHTMGSVGFFWEREGMMFMGDSAMAQGSLPGIIPVLFYPLAYSRTLQKLLSMPIGMVATAHYYHSLRCSPNPIKKGSQQITMYFQDCQEIHNRILEAMGKAIHRHWGAPFATVVASAVDSLEGRLYLRREPANGLPAGAIRTLACYYDEILKSL